MNLNVFRQEFSCFSFHGIQQSRSFCLLQQKISKTYLDQNQPKQNYVDVTSPHMQFVYQEFYNFY